MRPTLTAISRFPVKSLRGESLTEARVEPWGLTGDRRWMVVDESGEAITAREVNSMVLVHPRLVPGGLVVEAAGQVDLEVPEPTGASRTVSVHGKPLPAVPADDVAHAWFSDVLGCSAQLVFLDDPTARAVNPAFGLPEDRVSFADGYPLLLTTQASLSALNALVAEGPNARLAPLPMTRFRPNLVVGGTAAWEEDAWRRIRIGDAVFRAPKGCERCVMTAIDPDTAARSHEPIATLARHRRYDGLTWFGMNLIPDAPYASLRVGDELEILDAVPDPDGPPR